MKVMLRGMVAVVACALAACGGSGDGVDFTDNGVDTGADKSTDAGVARTHDGSAITGVAADGGAVTDPVTPADSGATSDDDAAPSPMPTTTTSTGNPPPPPVDAGHDAAPPPHGCMTTNGLYTVSESTGAVSCSSPSSAFPCSASSGLTATYVAFVDGHGNLVGSYPSPPVKHICDPPGGSCVVHGIDGQGHAATMYDGVCQ